MRTKTPQQIYTQASRILIAIAFSHWDGEKYIRINEMHDKLEKVNKIRERYVNNIYKYYSNNRKYISTEESNGIYNTPTDVSIYTR